MYDELSSLLQANGIASDAAEIQGILTGMLAGGMPLNSKDWLAPLADFIFQGEAFPNDVSLAIKRLFEQTRSELTASDFSLLLCLPDDAAPINDRGQALLKWVQGFMLGFGLHQADLTRCSDEVKEALDDFSEISRMEEDMPEDEEAEQALFEVMEYVRVSAMLCFNELGDKGASLTPQSNTLH